ncbi:SpoIID/LytB domain-containing protein [uncultured Flavonifractor sp.]|uniref:SpoIID/LytB domain-containing protein n=1 Tax=uncultured Flavonifractor sp. TaxID=1193534 RepID=UPI002603546D|nr:SpoIID/LytB domain-containing protein [uncultured Flavonifractor sp.]
MQVAACALAILTLSLPVPTRAAVEVDPTIKVGLFYGSNALPGANLLNDVGSGYRLGYFDDDRVFQQLTATSETAISVVKTQNVYYGTVGNWAGYYDTITSSIAVGCWHLKLPGSYSSYDEAAAAASAYSGGFVAWIDGTWQARVGAWLDKTSAQAGQAQLGLADAEIVGTSSYGVSVVKTGTSQILFQFDGGSSRCLGIQPGLDDSVKTETIFRGNTYYGGFQYQRVSGGNLTVSNVIGLEDYVQGVIVREMSSSWPLEALKAQAVCARTYAYRNYIAGKHKSQGFDLCNTIDCQAYYGMDEVTASSSKAVEQTYGEYAWYNGSLIEAVYSSHDGGATESAVNVWGSNVAYLIGKYDPYEASVASKVPSYNWTVTYTAQELTDLLNSKGYTNSGIVDFRVTKTSPTGNAIEITFTDSSGKSWSKIRDACRTFLNLRSIHYTVSSSSGSGSSGGGGSYSVNGDGTLSSLDGAYAIDGSGSTSKLGSDVYMIDGSGQVSQAVPSGGSGGGTSTGGETVFTITGSGWGHNVGMSQWGAYAMAQQGYTYLDILTFYYTGIEVRQP